MKATQFTEHAEVLKVIDSLKKAGIRQKKFTDIADDEGLQYVDLVMEGGGVLGIALVGFVYVLEEMGIRFLKMGGASAGSINAMLMAAAGPINERKSAWITEKLANKNLGELVDGDNDAKDFVKALLEKSKTIKMMWKGWQVIDNFNEDFGLNPGDNFHEWLSGMLREKGVHTMADLNRIREEMPAGLRNIRNNEPYKNYKRLGFVSADITTSTKTTFPEMADLYWADPEAVNPADFIRASMSIPLFFHPFRVKNIPTGPGQRDKWKEKSGFLGNIPEEVFFIDGGMMSNFPIDLFHNFNSVPTAPTFGVKLGVDRVSPNNISKFPQMAGATFDSIRNVHDYTFLQKNPDYRHLIAIIRYGNHDWLDFYLSDEAKIDLFKNGAIYAGEFLQTFNWENYKDVRKSLAEMNVKSDRMKGQAEANS
ncbi:MAG: patatin-like phospholipase family protein [Bacteroidia bacterium]